jgi:hypothetical protein
VHGYVQQCNAARGSDQEAFDAIHHGIGSQCVFDQVRQRVGYRGLGFVGATFHRGPTILLGVLIEKTCVCVDSSLRLGGGNRCLTQRRKDAKNTDRGDRLFGALSFDFLFGFPFAILAS